MKQILAILKTNLKRKSLLLLNVLIRPFRKRKVRRMLHRIRNLQLAMKVPKQLMQKLKAKPQSPKKKTLKKKAVRTIAKAHVKRRKLNLAMMKRILARKKQQKKLQAPQKKHRLLRIVKFLRRKKAK